MSRKPRKRYINREAIEYRRCLCCGKSYPLASFDRDKHGELTDRIYVHENLYCRPCLRAQAAGGGNDAS